MIAVGYEYSETYASEHTHNTTELSRFSRHRCGSYMFCIMETDVCSITYNSLPDQIRFGKYVLCNIKISVFPRLRRIVYAQGQNTTRETQFNLVDKFHFNAVINIFD